MDLPHIGQPAPNFKSKAVLNEKVYDIALSDYDKKYLVLIFFPMNFTYVCPTELIAFSDHINDFRQINTEVVACAVESHMSHLKWASIPHKEGGIHGLRIPLIADKTMAMTKAYGVLDEDEGIAYRAMFIIDDKGTVRQITINDLQVGRNVSETLRLVKAIQDADRLREISPLTQFPEVTTTNTRKHRPLTCPEKLSIREILE